jgi:hypothetical protein
MSSAIVEEPQRGCRSYERLLTNQLRAGKRGQAREAAGTKILQNWRDLEGRSDRWWTRVPALAFPQSSLAASPAMTGHRRRGHASAAARKGAP